MKKIQLLICLLAFSTLHAQDKYIDSLQTELFHANTPLKRFSISVAIAEKQLVLGGGGIDSGLTIRLLQIAQALKNDSLLSIGYNWVGSYFAFNRGDNITALEYYFKAIPLAEKAHDLRRVSSLYFDIALVYFTLQNKEQALLNIRKGGNSLPDSNFPMYDFMLLQYQRNMAAYFLWDKQYDSCIHYTQALEETCNRLQSISFRYGAYYISAAAYAGKGDDALADVFFNKARELTPEINSLSGRLPYFEYYISFLLHNKRLPEALSQARLLMALSKEADNNNMKRSGAGLLQQVFDALHQTDSAYYYAKMEAGVNATIFNQDNSNKIQALAFNEQLRLMEEQVQKAEEAQQRKENVQYVLMTIGIIVFLIMYLLLSRSFITNPRLIRFFGVLALLIVFEFLNLLLHPFLEKITHHSPVWILVALVCMASLLVPLHHRLEKWATTRLIEKNRRIRLAAARKTIQELEQENERKG